MVSRIPEFPHFCELSLDGDNFDYVYLREELAQLPGKKFHKRRNRLLKFLREEAQGYEYSDLSARDEEECLQLAEGWCDIRCSVERPSTFLETEACILLRRNCSVP